MRERIEGQTRHLYILICQLSFKIHSYFLGTLIACHFPTIPLASRSLTLMSINPCLLHPATAVVMPGDLPSIKSAHQLIVCTTQKLGHNWLHDNSRLRFYSLGGASWLKRWAAILHCQISCLTPSLGNLLCQYSRRACIDLVAVCRLITGYKVRTRSIWLIMLIFLRRAI
jgi:hypothetical protein